MNTDANMTRVGRTARFSALIILAKKTSKSNGAPLRNDIVRKQQKLAILVREIGVAEMLLMMESDEHLRNDIVRKQQELAILVREIGVAEMLE
jgi:hypothetical protein